MPRVKNSQRMSVQHRPGRLKLLTRRIRRHPRMVFAVTGLAVLMFLGGLAARKAEPGSMLAAAQARLTQLSASAGLRVRHIQVEGRATTPENILRAAIGVTPGAPILEVSLPAMKQRIETLTSVDTATIERRLPDRLVIRLVEREPIAIWQYQGRFSLIDRAGKMVERDLAKSQGLPLIVGAGAAAAAAPLLDALNDHPALMKRVAAAVRVGERRWNLRLKSGADILLPEGHAAAAITRLMALHQDQDLLDRPLKLVDLRLPDRLVVRPLKEAKPEDPQPARGAAPRQPT